MEKLYNLPAVKITDIKKLRDILDKKETHVRGFKALEVAIQLYDKLLIPLLQPKLAFPKITSICNASQLMGKASAGLL